MLLLRRKVRIINENTGIITEFVKEWMCQNIKYSC